MRGRRRGGCRGTTPALTKRATVVFLISFPFLFLSFTCCLYETLHGKKLFPVSLSRSRVIILSVHRTPVSSDGLLPSNIDALSPDSISSPSFILLRGNTTQSRFSKTPLFWHPNNENATEFPRSRRATGEPPREHRDRPLADLLTMAMAWGIHLPVNGPDLIGPSPIPDGQFARLSRAKVEEGPFLI